jgi:hypothetical protein
MKNVRKFVLAAVIAAPLALCAQPAEMPAEQTQKAVATQTATTTHQPRSAKRAFQKVLHGLNPVTWAAYLSKREYCTYAYSQAYGICEGTRGGR